MKKRKTVAVLMAAAPDENAYEGAEIVRKKYSPKLTDEQIMKLADEFHEFLINNVEGRFYDALHKIMSEYVGD